MMPPALVPLTAALFFSLASATLTYALFTNRHYLSSRFLAIGYGLLALNAWFVVVNLRTALERSGLLP